MKTLVFLVVSILSASQVAQAESIQISVSKQSPGMQAVDRPRNGMNKKDVELKYGPPQEVTAAVGNPPISMWIYKDYSVYFENDLVLHTVLNMESSAK
jgi:hypothetical protein